MTVKPPADTARRPSSHALGVLLIVVSACAFGSGPLIVQPLYADGMEPSVILYWRFLTAALFGWGYLLASQRRRAGLWTLTRRRLGALVFLGALYVGNSFAYFAALQEVPVTLASIVFYLYPAIVAVLATRLVRRLEGRRAWIALSISMVGVALAIGGVPAGDLPPLWAMLLAFANPAIYAVWIVIQARLAGDRPRRAEDGVIDVPPADAEAAAGVPDPAPAAAIMTSATAVAYAIIVLAGGRSLSPADVATGAWPALLAFGLIATAIAIQTFYAGVRRVGGARASLISTIEPVYTIVLALLLFGEHLTPVQWLGGALVIGAVLLAETGPRDRGRRTVVTDGA